MNRIAAVIAGLSLAFVGTSNSQASDVTLHPGDSIQDAINNSSSDDTITLLAGTFNQSNLNTTGLAITIQGTLNSDGTLATTIDAQQGGSVFVINSGEDAGTVIKDLVITGGQNNWSGGGINCNNNSSPTITGCTISGNTTDYGGGIACDNSSPTITGCTITDNTATRNGGGILCNDVSNATITNCTITGNTATGGAFNRDCGGGGIYCGSDSSPTISGCTISGNTATDGAYALGGGIYCAGSNPTITNCTISDNMASDHGGGIDCYLDSNPIITACSFTNNTPDTIHGNFTMGPPESPTGACCLGGTCITATESDCTTSDGTYAGDDVACADAVCPADNTGDVDGDGDVDTDDLNTLHTDLGICKHDTNHNGVTDIEDLLGIVDGWGTTCQ